MERKFLYIVPFKPAMLKKKALLEELNEEEGVSAGWFDKNYPGVRVEADHRLDTGWLAGVFAQYGSADTIQEYTYTKDIRDFPSRPLTDEEAENLEKQQRKAYTSDSFFFIFGFAAMGLGTLYAGISGGDILFLLIAAILFVCLGVSIRGHFRNKKEAAEMKFVREDYAAAETFCCNSWSEDRKERETSADGTEQTVSHTYYYHELAAEGLAYDHRESGRMTIGSPRTVLYRKATGYIL